MAERLGLSGHDQLHHFITSPAWDDTPLWGVLAEQADQLVGGPDAVLVVDDSGMPKKGRDCLMFGGQAAAAKVGWVSFAGANLCPKAEPKVPL